MSPEIRKLTIEEYSENRKQALREAHGENWKEIIKKKLNESDNMKQKCSMCNKETSVRKDVHEKRIKQFGSVENLNKGYKCRTCKKISKMRKAGKSYEEIGEAVNLNRQQVSELLNGKQ